MKTYKLISNNENETKNLGKKIASLVSPKSVIVLSGELGAGKTKFTEGFLSHFGLANEISSPTFTIVNEYLNDKITIYHFDVYRLENSSEFYEIGGEEYFEKGICLIEWGEIIKDALPKNTIYICLEKDKSNDNVRIINIKSEEELF